MIFLGRISSISVAFCALLVFIGCGKPGTEEVTIRFLDTEDKSGAWAEIITSFEAKHPDIKVELIEGPASTDTRETQYATSLLAEDSTYDLVWMDVIWLSKFAEKDWLVALDDRFAPDMRAKYLDGDIKASTYKGSIYRIPIRSNGGMLYYRKDLLEEAGVEPPATFDDLVAAAKKLQSPPDLRGFVFQGKQYEGLTCAFLEILRGFGGDVLDDGGRCVFDSEESRAALTWMRDAIFEHEIVPRGITTYEENETLADFLSGRSIFMRNWPYAWKRCQEETSAIRGKVGIIPMVSAPGKESSATHGGWGFGISTFSRRQEEAWKFALHAAGAESLKIFARKQGGTPTLKALYEDPELLSLYPHYPDLYDALKNVDPRPVHPRYPEISDSLQRHVSAVLTRAETPGEAVEKATEEINRILAK